MFVAKAFISPFNTEEMDITHFIENSTAMLP
jgi:hypothetical protein